MPENTLDAVIYGKEHLDGIEIDIHISKDRTLWLSHDLEVGSCGGTVYNCFPETYDEEINIDHIEMIRKKGLKIQLWVIYTENQFNETLVLNPDFIQTDNIEFVKSFQLESGD